MCSTSGGVFWCMGKNDRPVFVATSGTTCSTSQFNSGCHPDFHLRQTHSTPGSSKCSCYHCTFQHRSGPACLRVRMSLSTTDFGLHVEGASHEAIEDMMCVSPCSIGYSATMGTHTYPSSEHMGSLAWCFLASVT